MSPPDEWPPLIVQQWLNRETVNATKLAACLRAWADFIDPRGES